MDVSQLDAKIVSLVVSLLAVQLVLGLTLQLFWWFRTPIVVVQTIIAGLLISLVGLCAPLFVAVLFLIVQVYMLFHLLRFMRTGANQPLLARKSWRTQIALSAASLGTLGLWIMEERGGNILGWLVLAQLLGAIWLLAYTVRSFRRTQPLIIKQHKSDQELPTLSVAIPARNETAELTETLEVLLRSDYPKLEILVLDDCSQDNTSSIIRSYAHRGVRFLKGLEVNDKWLAKNYAYDQLIDNASGKYVLFAGVDVRFGEQSLRLVMGEMIESNLGMMSIMPLRPAVLYHRYLLQPMRYWRELAIPRLFKSTPPSLSTCWVVERKALQKKLGGFEGLRRTIRPERYIARSFDLKGQYRFVRSSPELGIRSVKSLAAQWHTAQRTRYPELQNRPENVFFTSLWQLVLLLGPFLGVIYGLLVSDALVLAACLAAVLLLGAVHGLVFYMTTNKVSLEAIVFLPISIAIEIIVTNYSMWSYEYSKVLWKGRNICLPVLQVQSRLPKLPANRK